ncbi:hemerythrin domain-containing protein (plasmid) [Paraburkholderia sprentiae WSM5005]|uniref:Hemerythrin domain-containing protein n=1 Tax=Paraburkholderia sprentiae WSM5005 TaxID=754502 RepID=A0A1I9YUF8_9BURK|nr:hemerythrin domain-containing protein [Paraburkholderia sprentiae]APA89842.1 hemerythrin domain-containing protein [Paraburkholderia sprentiae WSM5005]
MNDRVTKSAKSASDDTTPSAPRETARAADALALLEADHRAVEKLFDAFAQSRGDQRDTLDAKAALAQRACEELTMHTIIEEELLYPAAQQALPEDDELDVDEAFVEHFLVKTLIAKFETLKPGDQGFDATFKVMSELVRHHIEEEEGQLFPALRRTGCDLAALGNKIAARKQTLQARLDEAGARAVGDKT